MSTLTVSFQLPTSTITSQATQDWTLGAQVDQAGAALVRVGQGLVTIVVWVCVVVLPLALAVFVLFAIALLIRRILRRGRRGSTAVGA
jgi:Flp pilus assembly protein TadB